MPVINYQGTSLSSTQKQELIKKIAEVASEITNTPEQFFTIIIQEFDEESIGMGGKTVKQIKSEIQSKKQ
jgi:4-oxalocrotonate tautomerase